jgi:cytochrome c oxidase subunit 3
MTTETTVQEAPAAAPVPPPHDTPGSDPSGHHDGGADQEHPAFLAHHFDTPEQQYDAAKLGMWAFLGQELLFFSGLFVAYGIFRSWHPEAFAAASHELNKTMGTVNTIVLLFSSLTAALAVRAAQRGEKDKTTWLLVATIVCAFIFLGVKYFEYEHKFHLGLLPGKWYGVPRSFPDGALLQGEEVPVLPAGASAFFSLYFVMTAVHAIHIIVGIGVLTWILKRNLKGEFSKEFFTPVDNVALYWHLVDLVWIYLFPLLYLID